MSDQRSQYSSLHYAGLLVCLLLGAFWTLWVKGQVWSLVLLVATLLAMAWVLIREKKASAAQDEPPRSMESAKQAWLRVVVFTVVAGGLIFLIGWWTGACRLDSLTFVWDKSLVEFLVSKLPTVVGQQLLLQLFLLPILLRLTGRTTTAIAGGALIFALLHLPNPLLMVLTLIGGAFWMASYKRSGRLLPLICSHCVLATLVAGVGGEYLLNMRVGRLCLELLPRKLQEDREDCWEYPMCVVGSAERLVQQADQITISGWAFDPIYHDAPARMALNFGGRLVEATSVEFSPCSVDKFKSSRDAGFVDDQCYAFEAVFPQARCKVGLVSNDVEVFVSNRNRHWAKLNRMGTLRLIDFVGDQAVVLFPVEVDGRVDWAQRNEGELSLRGWAADLNQSKLVDQVLVCFDGQQTLHELGSHRLDRPDIAHTYKQDAFLHSGFEISFMEYRRSLAGDLQCYAVDSKQCLHPLSLTPSAAAIINGPAVAGQ